MSMIQKNNVKKSHPVTAKIHTISRIIALIGGTLFVAISCVTVISVLTRYFFNAPISGDVEIVEIGSVIAIACFMPWCQWRRGHVRVEIFTENIPRKIKNIIDNIALIIMSAALTLLAARTAAGARDMFHYQDQTMFLSLKLWWAAGFLAVIMILCAAIACLDLRCSTRAENEKSENQ